MIRFLFPLLPRPFPARRARAGRPPRRSTRPAGTPASRRRPRRTESRLAYVELGDPKGEPLLLLHGYTDTSRSWTQVAPYLLRHRLLIPDQRGHGGSDSPACCYSVSVFAEDARLFLDALKRGEGGGGRPFARARWSR